MRMTRFIPTLLLLLAATPDIVAQSPTPAGDRDLIRARYTKYEFKIPMRDGVKLHTAVYVPKDDSQTYPMLLTRTPYSCSPYGVDHYPESLRPGRHYVDSGYIFVIQDVRGRWMSEGEYENVRPHLPNKTGKQTDESSDTYDTIDWLLNNVPGHNGKVGQFGISYPGFYTACGMIDAHPALKAASPQAPVTDWFIGDDFHHNGCFFLPHAFNFMYGFGAARPYPTSQFGRPAFDHGTPDGYQFFLDMGPLKNANEKHFKDRIAYWKELMAHGTYDDWWQARNIRPHIKDVKPACLTVGGWFDAENLFGALKTFQMADRTKKDGSNHLVMGPWNHGGWYRMDGDTLGDLRFGSKTGEYYRNNIEFPFFEHQLKGKPDPKLAKAVVFETGTNRWRHFDSWPPKINGQSLTTSFTLDADGLLAWGLAKKSSTGFDEFISDPAKPVPFCEKYTPRMPADYMTYDQRFAGRRTDVLVYTSPVLESDRTLAGPVTVNLNVSTTGTDADWVVKLIDVYPSDFPDPDPNPTGVKMGGYQQLIRGEIFRGKFRNSFSQPEPFEPGKPTPVTFVMPDVLHTVRPGHRIMVQIQSSWFPLSDRNPQTFTDIYTADEKAFRKQTHRVHHGSTITVGIAP